MGADKSPQTPQKCQGEAQDEALVYVPPPMSLQRTSAGLSVEGRCSLGAYSGGPEAKVWTREPNCSSPDSSLQSLSQQEPGKGLGGFQ